jgi:hypothetical protein
VIFLVLIFPVYLLFSSVLQSFLPALDKSFTTQIEHDQLQHEALRTSTCLAEEKDHYLLWYALEFNLTLPHAMHCTPMR